MIRMCSERSQAPQGCRVVTNRGTSFPPKGDDLGQDGGLASRRELFGIGYPKDS
jgi:hypothetical protein